MSTSKLKYSMQRRRKPYMRQLSVYASVLGRRGIAITDMDDDGAVSFRCGKCGQKFSFDAGSLFMMVRDLTSRGTICPECLDKSRVGVSMEETDVLEYIRGIYGGDVRHNDRDALHGREIDIYLPELRLGFEFDGTYWHADPRFYAEDDLVAERRAGDIWRRDAEKDRMCRDAGIRLVRIKEYDWLGDKPGQCSLIREKIENLKTIDKNR